MTDNAEMGERPADPATRGGVGVGAGPDDYAEGMAEEQIERLGESANPRDAAPRQADADVPPGGAQTPLAETDAMSNRMAPVDEWGTGDRELPQEGPSEELNSDV
jgi:hypothetical protein